MKQLSDNPVIRLIVAVVFVAIGIRLAVELLRPVMSVALGVAIGASASYVVWFFTRDRDRW